MELQTIQGSFKEVPKGLGSMAVMGLDGDTKHMWDKNNEVEVEAARVLFNTLVEKGYRAFKVTETGEEGEGPITEFDPEEERYVFMPQMQGG